MQPNTSRPLYKVRHDGVPADHPDESVRRLFAGKKNVTNQVTRYKSSAEKTASMLKTKGFKNVRIEESEMQGLNFRQLRQSIIEKTLTPAEMKKREEVAKAIKREHPGMPMGMKMAIATKTAKRVAEDTEQIDELRNVTQDQLGGRMGSSGPGFNKTPAGKAREVKRKQEHLKGQMQFTKSQGGIAGPKGKLPEEVENTVTEGSGSKEKQKTPYRDINSPASRAAADKKRKEMAQTAAAAPGKRLLGLISKKAAKLKENFASDFLAMAREKNPNAKISTADQRKKEAEELAKKRAHLKPAHAGPSGNPRPLGGYDPKSGRSYSE